MENISNSIAQLSQLSQQFAVKNKPFPLAALLRIYIKNERVSDYDSSVYCRNFEGFRWLVDWLGPIEIPVSPPTFHSRVDSILISYECDQIAQILGVSPELIWQLIMEIKDNEC